MTFGKFIHKARIRTKVLPRDFHEEPGHFPGHARQPDQPLQMRFDPGCKSLEILPDVPDRLLLLNPLRPHRLIYGNAGINALIGVGTERL